MAAFLLEGACSEDGESVSITIASRSAVTALCTPTGWHYTADLETGLSDGNISLLLTLEDAAGNPVEESFTLKRNTALPTLTLDDSSALPPMNAENASAYSVQGNCDDGDTVHLSIQGLASTPSTQCGTFNYIPNRWLIATGDFSNLADGTNIVLRVTATNDHGNETHIDATFDKDATTPVVSIDELVELTESNEAQFPLAGDCSEEGKDVQVSAGSVVPNTDPTCAGGRWSTQIDLSALGGAIDINALQRDDFDNLGSAPVVTLVKEVIRQRFFYSRIAVGGYHTCIITDNSQVLCWGNYDHSQLGNDVTGSTNEYQPYPDGYVVEEDGSTTPLTGVLSLVAGNLHTCALTTAGQVWCWGQGSSGKLGNDATIDSDHPVAVVTGDGSTNPLTGVLSLAAGGGHTCALTTTSRVWCWGSGNFGQLGNDAGISSDHPVAVVDGAGSINPLTGVISLAAGDNHTCAITSGGGALCWGRGNAGQLGSSSETYYVADDGEYVGYNREAPLPVLVADEGIPLSGVLEIVGGLTHTCALLEDSGVKCWGHESYGRLGNGSIGYTLDEYDTKVYTRQFFPVDVLETPGGVSFTGATELTANAEGTCAITDLEGGVNCWGTSTFGELGHGQSGYINYVAVHRTTPGSVIIAQGSSEALNSVMEIAKTNGRNNCVLPSKGGVLCWGKNDHGQLGDNTSSNRNAPILVVDGPDSTGFLNDFNAFRRTYSCEQGANSCQQDSVDQIQLALDSSSPTPGTSDSISIEVSGLASGDSLALYSTKDCSGTALTTTTNTPVAVSGLAEGSHVFHFKITAADSSVSDCSKSFLSYHYDATDPAAVTLSLAQTSGTNATPDVTVSDIEPGNLVELYSDSNCSTSAADAVRVNGVSKNIPVDTLTTGAHTFYAKTTDLTGNESVCSSGVTYTLN